jgi:hypothetical protein
MPGGGAIGDGPIGQIQQFVAAAAHLDGDVAQGGSPEFQARGLAVIRATHRFEFPNRVLLELLDRHLESF